MTLNGFAQIRSAAP